MKICLRVANAVFYLLVAMILLASVGTGISGRPFFLSVIRSHSMYPLLTRGDLVLIKNLPAKKDLREGDVVLFKTEEGSLSSQGWIIHRIVGGNENEGYITQGDFNDETDQETGSSVPIKREWIVSKALTLLGFPLKIPLLGYVPLWAEGLQKNNYALPIIGIILAAVLAAAEMGPQGRKHARSRRTQGLEKPLTYVLGGLTLTVVLVASMLTSSQNLTLVYEVSPGSKGVLMGSSVGIMQVGETAERPLVELNNKTVLPIVATCTSGDRQLSFSKDVLYLKKGQETTVNFTVEAQRPGKYESKIWVGMFFPFLPAALIYALAKQSFWLALFVVALLPALPFILYPLWDGTLRRQLKKELARQWRRAWAKF